MDDPGVQVGIRRFLGVQRGSGAATSGNSANPFASAGAASRPPAAAADAGGKAQPKGGSGARPVLFELLGGAPSAAAAPAVHRHQLPRALPPLPKQPPQQRAKHRTNAAAAEQHTGAAESRTARKDQRERGGWQQQQQQQQGQSKLPGQRHGHPKRAVRSPQPQQQAKRPHGGSTRPGSAPMQHLLGPLRTLASEPDARGAEPEGGFNYWDDGAGEMDDSMIGLSGAPQHAGELAWEGVGRCGVARALRD
ncbi:hypothetical protein Rsub_10822 [Raphidocelis subcapitata]|uniref:Uncharacterized protein n=1 Tax=Raphidocelis subcapitata TaxID=307507 RepID=A0A2V0PKU1_9CHLO|nr:hypothetical protein Rsub_10822 [Raphidocelis subcapitata]|eukprot:GBF98633.1 hypothetical protein Rsub_10822 [Raphidocelis subcapitata]